MWIPTFLIFTCCIPWPPPYALCLWIVYFLEKQTEHLGFFLGPLWELARVTLFPGSDFKTFSFTSPLVGKYF